MSADAIAFQLKLDEISPAPADRADDELKKNILLGMGTVIESHAVCAFARAEPATESARRARPAIRC